MQDAVRTYIEEAKKWNLVDSPWWIVDLQNSPDRLYCGEAFALLLGLDPTEQSHSIEALFRSAAAEPNVQAEAFLGVVNLQQGQSDLNDIPFQWFDQASKSVRYYRNRIRVVTRDELSNPAVVYGVVSDVKKSTLNHYETLFESYFDELISQHGYGYKWIVDLDNLLIYPDDSMALLHGGGWVAGQWYPFDGIYDWTPEAFRAQVKLDTDNFRRAIKAGEFCELNVVHPHNHSLTGRVHWYNVRGRHVVIGGRNYSVGVSIDVTEQYEMQQQLEEQLARGLVLSSSGEVGSWNYDPVSQLVEYDKTLCDWIGTGVSPGEPCTLEVVMSTMTPTQKERYMHDVKLGIEQILIDRTAEDYTWYHNIWDRVVKAVAKRVCVNGVERVVGISFDITDLVKQQRKSRSLLHQLNASAELGGVGLFSYDVATDLFKVNDAFRTIYDLPKSEYPTISSKDINQRLSPDSAAEYKKRRMDVLRDRRSIVDERNLLLPDGTRKQIRLSMSPIVIEGEVTGLSGSSIDLTIDIERQHQLEEMLCEREEMLRKQQQMFAVIGHELRTPVAALHMLMEDDELDDCAKVKEISGLTEGLLSILDDLRLVNDPERVTELRSKVEDPNAVIERALISVKSLVEKQGLKLHFEPAPESIVMRLSSQALRQAVINLVKNAAVHSRGSNIYVSLSYAQSQNATQLANLQVADDGRGIPKEKRARLFEAFERGDTSADGSGLGLYCTYSGD